MMQPQLFRIDDRLIHGQVVIGWATKLKSERIVLCDNDVAKNEWEKQLYLACVAKSLDTKVLDTRDAGEFLSDSNQILDKTIVLVKSPFVVKEIMKFGFKPLCINVGGIHFSANRHELLPYIYLTDEDIDCFRDLQKEGIEIYCQDVPGSKKYNLFELVKP